MSYKILWCHTFLFGPRDGLCTDLTSDEDKFWFKRTTQDVDEIKHTFDLLKLSEDDLKTVEQDHQDYCKATGEPLLYGEPHKRQPRLMYRKMDESQIPVSSDGGFEAKYRGMMITQKYNHSFDSGLVRGEVVAKISEDDFINYLVPHSISKTVTK